MIDLLKRVPVKEQDPAVRINNFDEVCLGYTDKEAILEASRCLNCKNPQCVLGCPVKIDIPSFINKIKEGMKLLFTISVCKLSILGNELELHS